MFILLCLICAVMFALYNRKKFQYWKDRKVPHKSPNFLFGNFLDIAAYNRTLDHKNITRNYYNYFDKERFYGIYLFNKPVLMVRDRDIVHSILVKDFDHFVERYSFGNDYDVLIQNLIGLPPAKWKSLRQKLTPIFTSNKHRRMFPLMLVQCENLAKYIERYELSEDNTNFYQIALRNTMNLVFSVAFGFELPMEKGVTSEVHQLGHSVTEDSLMNFLRFGMRITLEKICNLFRVRMFSKWTEDGFLRIIKHVVETKERTGIKRGDFIDLLMELEDIENWCSENDRIKFITAQAFQFFLAGFMSISALLSFALFEVAYNSDVQEKLYSEIKDVLDGNSGKVTYESIARMPYMEATIKETLRKYTSFPYLFRTCVKQFRIPDSDYCIEKGMTVVIPLFNLSNDSKYYSNPHKFDPERFLNRTGEKHPMAYIPFGAGQRSCIASRFSIILAKIGLISLLRHFEVKPCKKSQYPQPIHAPMLVLKPKNGLWIKFERRL